jgi:hypothetical protein
MGRFYSGDINGKFWFGIQSSYDISNLLDIEPNVVLEWYGCRCTLHDDNNEDDKYCFDCFTSEKEFLDAAADDMKMDNSENPYYETNEIVYDISSSQYLKPLEDKLNELEQKIHKSLIDAIKEITEDISDAFSGVFDNVFAVQQQLINEKKTDLVIQDVEVEVEVEENLELPSEENTIINITESNPVNQEEVVSLDDSLHDLSDDLLNEELLARYILGFQIKQHLLTNEYCCVYCEL